MFCDHGDANIVARFLNEKGKLSVLTQNFKLHESTGVYGFSIHRANNSVFTISIGGKLIVRLVKN